MIPAHASNEYEVYKHDGFIALRKPGIVYMTNDDWILAPYRCVDDFSGDILMCGLGLGYSVFLCIDNSNITHVDVIERRPDIIALVEPYVRNAKVTVVEADIFDYVPTCSSKYDTVFYDCFVLGEAGEDKKKELRDMTELIWPETKLVFWEQ
jgi:spermidine synthase